MNINQIIWTILGFWGLIGMQVMCGMEPEEVCMLEFKNRTFLQQLFISFFLGPIAWAMVMCAIIIRIIYRFFNQVYIFLGK